MTRRILQVIPSLDRAGAEKELVQICRGLPRDEFDVHVCALTRGGPFEAELAEASVPVTVIGKRWKADPTSYWKLRRHIRQLRPELVQTWLFAANAYGRTAARACAVPKILASEQCVDQWKSRYQWAIDRRLAQCTDRIVVNSAAIRDYCVEHGIPADKFSVIPGGIEPFDAGQVEGHTTRAELLDELDIADDGRLIGAIGRLWPQKRVKDLIWAMELVTMLHPTAHLLVIGDGPERRRLERFAHQLQCGDRIRFLGHRDDVPRIMPHLDMLWIGSEYEGLPNAVMEAMAAGRPVVATDIPGNRELIGSDELGLLVPVAGRANRVRATDRLLNDPQLASRIGAAARDHVLREFSVEQMIDRHVKLYREVLGG